MRVFLIWLIALPVSASNIALPTDSGWFLADDAVAVLHAGSTRMVFSSRGLAPFRLGDRSMVAGLGFDGAARFWRLEEPSGHVVHYLVGPPEQWRRNLKTWRKLVYPNAWPGIDIVFSTSSGRLSCQIVLAPGADPAHVVLTTGSDTLSKRHGGGLSAEGLTVGPLRARRADTGASVSASYRLLGNGRIGFHVPDAVRGAELILEPAFSWAGYLGGPGGEGEEQALAVTVDSLGRAYVAGVTRAADFPTVAGIDDSWNGGSDIFITRLNADGSGLIESTYLGGSGDEEPTDITLDGQGRLIITGHTFSADFPTTKGAADTTYGGSGDGFVTRLSSDGLALSYSTYLGGSDEEIAGALDVNDAGEVFLVGTTYSADFPTTAGAFQETLSDAAGEPFVAKLAADGSALAYATLIGGTGADMGTGIAVDANGRAHITGIAGFDFPVTKGAFDTTPSFNDVFVAAISADGSAQVYGTFLARSSMDHRPRLALGPTGDVYVSSTTSEFSFPTTAGAWQEDHGGITDVFVTRLTPDGSALVYSTFVGGNTAERGFDLAVDSSGAAYITGRGFSGFPGDARASDGTPNASWEAFAAKLSPDGSSLTYATLIAGGNAEEGSALAVDASGAVYVAGYTLSTDFPVTAGAFDVQFDGAYEGFLAKLNPAGDTAEYVTFLGGSGSDEAEAVALDPAGRVYVTGSTWSPAFPVAGDTVDTSHNGDRDIFISRLSRDGDRLDYTTFLGGSGEDLGIAVDIGPDGSVYVAGETFSPDFPVAGPRGSVQSQDAVVARLSGDGSQLIYANRLGGSGSELTGGLAVDRIGNAFVTGRTGSGDFPTTPGAFSTALSGPLDAFITGFTPDGSTVIFSTYLGGSFNDYTTDIAVDVSGRAVITGSTSSTDFPVTAGAFDETPNGADDIFVARLSLSGDALDYSTYLGGIGTDFPTAIALDGDGRAHVTGYTDSVNFPVTGNAFDTVTGLRDAFAARFELGGTLLLYSTLFGDNAEGRDIGVDSEDRIIIAGITNGDLPVTADAFQPDYAGDGDGFLARFDTTTGDLTFADHLGGSGRDAVKGLAPDNLDNVVVVGETFSADFPATPDAAFPDAPSFGDGFAARIDLGCRPPSFTLIPADATACPGETVTLNAAFAGSAEHAFRWFKDDVEIPGATMESFELSPASESDSGVYRVELTNPCGTVLSLPFTLTVADGPFAAVVSPALRAQGRKPLTFRAGSGCATGAVTYSWEILESGLLFAGEEITLPLLTQSSTLRLTAEDAGSGETANAEARILVNPISTDLNGDGCNSRADLRTLAANWPDSGSVSVLDFFTVNLADATICP
ncbi:MAG: SBBP repeat-containing protein [Acidobacteriota bacterium]|nr:SBBP repeat-containing protein [Acidobacteriota bacterium]